MKHWPDCGSRPCPLGHAGWVHAEDDAAPVDSVKLPAGQAVHVALEVAPVAAEK